MNFNHEGKTVLVIGGASGIGESCCRAFVKEKSKIICADRNEEMMKNLSEQFDPQVFEYQFVDVSEIKSIDDLFNRIAKQHTCVDILVNSVGICQEKNLEKIDENDWDNVIDINLKGIFFCSQKAIPLLQKAPAGASIINIASVAAKLPDNAIGPHYAASKAGVLSVTWSLAEYLAPHGIRVNAVCPGIVNTPMTKGFSSEVKEKIVANIPLSRMACPEEIANAVLFLSSHLASFITGEALDVNGGGLMD